MGTVHRCCPRGRMCDGSQPARGRCQCAVASSAVSLTLPDIGHAKAAVRAGTAEVILGADPVGYHRPMPGALARQAPVPARARRSRPQANRPPAPGWACAVDESVLDPAALQRSFVRVASGRSLSPASAALTAQSEWSNRRCVRISHPLQLEQRAARYANDQSTHSGRHESTRGEGLRKRSVPAAPVDLNPCSLLVAMMLRTEVRATASRRVTKSNLRRPRARTSSSRTARSSMHLRY